MKIVALVNDLFFKSKIDAVATAQSMRLEFVDDAYRVPSVDLLLVDLEAFGLEGIQRVQEQHPGVKVVGFLSHVRVDLKKRAQGMGIRVVSRSEFTTQLGELLRGAH